jgi:hypothetical protein
MKIDLDKSSVFRKVSFLMNTTMDRMGSKQLEGQKRIKNNEGKVNK